MLTSLHLEQIWPWLAVVALGALLMLSWLVGGWQNMWRSRAMLAALNDSTRGRVVAEQAPGFAGFLARIQPAPEPFMQFIITYRAVSKLDLPGWLLWVVTRRTDRMIIQGRLVERPQAELVWARGQIPGRALGKSPSAALWVLHRLDITNSEYATRGANPAALIHVFTDLQTRFEPVLYKVSIQAEEIPEVEVVLRGSRLNADEIPALVTTIRAAGRAALLR
jgi:hypothetical protein